MREVGVRELKASLSKTLRAVSRGQRVRVTLRGQPVAEIVPAGQAGHCGHRLRQLVAEGRLTAPSRARSANQPSLVGVRKAASAVVLADRDAER